MSNINKERDALCKKITGTFEVVLLFLFFAVNLIEIACKSVTLH